MEGASEGKFTGQVGEDAPWPLGEGASGETPGSASLGSNVQATVSEEALVKSEAVEGSVCAPQFLNVLSEGKAAGDQQLLDGFGAERARMLFVRPTLRTAHEACVAQWRFIVFNAWFHPFDRTA